MVWQRMSTVNGRVPLVAGVPLTNLPPSYKSLRISTRATVSVAIVPTDMGIDAPFISPST